MEKKYLCELKEHNTQEIASALANRLHQRDKAPSNGIAIAYALYQIAHCDNVSIENEVEFVKSLCIPDTIKRFVGENLRDNWNIVMELNGQYQPDELLAYILFNNDLEAFKVEDCSTPSGLLKLAGSILEINEQDYVLELCSGKGNFFVETFSAQDNFRYTGIELNFVTNGIAQLRAYLLEKDIVLILNDAFEYRADKKADKLFANYPFMIKHPAMNEYKENIKKALNIPSEVVQRASSDWIFNATIIEQMSETGKAVAIMTNGATWNSTDKSIRQWFIEKGLVEAVISLPAKLFSGFSIPVTLIVFSFNNTAVKMIDAREICEKERKNNILSENNIKTIIDLLENDGEKSITVDVSDFADNEFILNATRYLEVLPKIENGVELSTVVKSITRGAQLRADNLNEMKSPKPTPYKYLMLSNINDGILSFDEEQFLKDIPENLSRFRVKNESIVLARTGLPTFKSAVAQIEDGTDLIATGNFFVIEVDETKINPFYLQSFFSSEVGTALFRSIYSGSGLPTISLDNLRRMTIPLPPLEIQNDIGRKYAATVDEVVLLKRKLDKAITRMKHIFDEEV